MQIFCNRLMIPNFLKVDKQLFMQRMEGLMERDH